MRSRILLADDSITIQKVVNLTFADEGIEVVAVSNGEMAEKRLSEINPDLVLADIFMPGKNGYELCETIKRNPQYKNVPVVLLVGAFEPFDQGEAKRVRADGHLTKPFESRMLVETVRKLISGNAKGKSGPLAQAAASDSPRTSPLDTNPITPPAPPPEAIVVPELPIEVNLGPVSETSPLDLDYNATQVAPPPTPPEPQKDVIGQFEGPFVRTTGALSSVGPGAVQQASDNGHAADAAAIETHVTASPAPHAPEATSPAQVDSQPEPAVSIGVPSRFGDAANDLILDFETSPEPAPPSPPSITSAPEELVEQPAEVVALNAEPAAQVFATPDTPLVVEDVVASPGQPEPAAAEASSSVVDAATAELEPPVAELASSESIQSEEPLGDILDGSPLGETEPEPLQAIQDSEEGPLAEAIATATPAEEPESQSQESNEAAGAATTSPDQRIIEEHAPLDVLMPPPIVPSMVETNDVEWDEPLAMMEDAVAEAPAPEYVAPPLHSEPAQEFTTSQSVENLADAAPEEFTSSSMWSEPEPRFAAIDTPIDIEATEVADTVPEPVSAIPPLESDTGLPAAEAIAAEPVASEPVPEQPVISDLKPASTEPAQVSSTMIDEIVKRVVAELSESVVREIAWEVVPDCVERVVTEMTRDGVAKRA